MTISSYSMTELMAKRAIYGDGFMIELGQVCGINQP
jgi:hypothetical protein